MDYKTSIIAVLETNFAGYKDEIINNAADIIEQISIKRPKGKWKPQHFSEEWYAPLYKCSLCEGEMVGVSDYCPHCGAKMEV